MDLIIDKANSGKLLALIARKAKEAKFSHVWVGLADPFVSN